MNSATPPEGTPLSGDRVPPDDTVVLNGPDDLGPAEVVAVSSGAGVRLTPELAGRLDAARAEMLSALETAHPVYGVTTGTGAAGDVRLTPEQQSTHQARLMLARQVGTEPWLDTATVRAGMAARLRTFLNGDSGVSSALCHALADFLNAGLTPAVPEGSHGAAGEIIPLAHVGGALSGRGLVVERQTPDSRGTPRDAAEACTEAGLDPHDFGPKEGIAVLQGTPLAMGAACRLAAEARAHHRQHLLVLAGTVRTAEANRDPYDTALARGDSGLEAVLRELNPLLEDGRTGTAAKQGSSLQSPVSFRVTPMALAHAGRSAEQLRADAVRALESVSDSPAFVEGRFLGTAAFDGFTLAASFDALRTSLLHLGELSAARLHRLLDERTNLRARQLSAEPGAHAGLVAVHKGAVGTMHRLLGESAPSSLGSRDTSFGQEDAQSFALEAYSAAARALRGVRKVLASELLALVQAARLQSVPGLRPELDVLLRSADAVVAPGVEDRPFGPDIAALTRFLET